METFIADLINNPKIPKWLRYVIVTLTCGFVVFLGIMLALKSPMLVGKIFGGGIFACKNCKVKTKENIHTLTMVEFEFSQ